MKRGNEEVEEDTEERWRERGGEKGKWSLQHHVCINIQGVLATGNWEYRRFLTRDA